MDAGNRSQAIIDFAVTFIAVAALIIGVVRIWAWFNANYLRRQVSYQQSRLIAAGRSRPAGKYDRAVSIGATSDCPDCEYQGLDLTEDWVFKGKGPETIAGGIPLGPLPGFSEKGCDRDCSEKCAYQPGCGSSADRTFNRLCDCYSRCETQCRCNDQIEAIIAGNREVLNRFRETAASLRKSAEELRKKAKKMKFGSMFYYIAGGYRSAKELKKGAKAMDNSAASLELSAKEYENRSAELRNCCSENITIAGQNDCIEMSRAKADCEVKCQEGDTEDVDSAMIQLEGCVAACVKSEISCEERINRIKSEIDGGIEGLKEDIETGKRLADDINNTFAVCAARANKTCSDNCAQQCLVCASGACKVDEQCYKPCFNGCYVLERNNCCKSGCCLNEAEPWLRDCDLPLENCDADCLCPEGAASCVCAKCGLAKLLSDTRKKLIDFNDILAQWERIKTELPDCCKKSGKEQDECIKQKTTAGGTK